MSEDDAVDRWMKKIEKYKTEDLMKLVALSMVTTHKTTAEGLGKEKIMTDHRERVRERIREKLQGETARLQFDPKPTIRTYNLALVRIRSSLEGKEVRPRERDAVEKIHYRFITKDSLEFGGNRGDI